MITVIEAQKMLVDLNIASYPYMTKTQQEKLHKELFEKAYPASYNEAKVLSNDEIMRLFNGK